MSLRTFFSREKKGSFDLQSLPIRIGATGRAAYPSTEVAALQAAYQRNEVVYACIRLLANSTNDPRLVVQTRKNKKAEWEDQDDHPLTRLMMKPNSEMDGAAFLRAHVASWETTRLFFAEKLKAPGRSVAELHPLNPAEMKADYNADRSAIIGWTWRRGNLSKSYTLEQLLIRRSPAWHDPAPIAVAMGSVDMDSAQTDFIRSFFDNGGTPPGIIKVKSKLRNGQAEELQAKWRGKYARNGTHYGAPAVFDEDGDYQRIGAQLNELDSDTLRGLSESRIATVFGIHPSILAILVGLKHSTYSNYREAQQALWDQTIMPMFKQLLSWLTWNLLTLYEEEERIYAGLVRLHLDTSDVAALSDDVDTRDKRARENYKAGLWKRDEARALTGKDPDPENDGYFKPPAPTALQASGDPNEQEDTNPGA